MQDKATLLFLTAIVYAGLALCLFTGVPLAPANAIASQAIAAPSSPSEDAADLSAPVPVPTGREALPLHRRGHHPPRGQPIPADASLS